MGLNLGSFGWQENYIYPGVHWLYHDKKGNYRARVDIQDKTYMWRVMRGYLKNDIVGWEETLEGAQAMAEKVMKGESFQLKLKWASTSTAELCRSGFDFPDVHRE